MQLTIFFLAMVLCLSSLGCGKKGDAEVVANKSQTAVGPFNMELSPEMSDKVNVFSVDINQDEGAVDYFVQNGSTMQYLVLDSYTATVRG